MFGSFWHNLGIWTLKQNAHDLMFSNIRGRSSGNVKWGLGMGDRNMLWTGNHVVWRPESVWKNIHWATLFSLSQPIRCYHTADLKLSSENRTGYMFHKNCFDMENTYSKVEETEGELKISKYLNIPFHPLFVWNKDVHFTSKRWHESYHGFHWCWFYS